MAAVTIASGITLASATTASAGGWGCSGTEVSGSPYLTHTTMTGAVLSYVHVFWNSSTGQNCAVNVKTGSLYGTKTLTDVTIYECAYDFTGSACGDYPGLPPLTSREDSNAFYYYAGPVSVPGSGHCIRVTADTYTPDGTDVAFFDSGAFHC
ncbi:hypothetical protein [Kitasatospora viridis]|nr:hypothetical protein [Kitasatospora viridis]